MAALVRYHPATVDVDITFERGPVDFRCFYEARVHDNLATSGLARERVTEAVDTILTFTMPHLVRGGDLEDWTRFAEWALTGGQFLLSPDAALEDYCTCISDDTAWQFARTGPGKYAASFRWRMVANKLTPDVVMDRFYGVAGA